LTEEEFEKDKYVKMSELQKIIDSNFEKRMKEEEYDYEGMLGNIEERRKFF